MDPASTAQQQTTDDKPQPFQDTSANSLDTDMSDEDLLAFVDKTLGPQPVIKNSFGHSQELPSPNEIANTPKEEKDEKAEGAPVTKEDKQEPPAPAPTGDEDKQPKSPTGTSGATLGDEPEKQTITETPELDISDLWVEVEGFEVDAEGNNPTPKTFRINVDEGFPDNIRFRDEKQMAEVLDAMQEMRGFKSEREAEYEQKIADQEKMTEQQSSQQARQQQWDQEIYDLQEAGLLERQKEPPKNPAGYTKEEIEADPALQKIDAVFKFMVEENARRQKEGKPLLGSFASTFNLYSKQERVIEEEKAQKEQDEATKRKGGMIGGGTGASSTGSGKGYIYKAGSAKSINDVKTDDL